jgi:purine-binding chemotaxis protein CheW
MSQSLLEKQERQMQAASPSQITAPGRRKYAQADLRVVVFQMSGREYVADVALVQEIIQPTDLIHMDGVPEYVEGVIKRRGRIVPIVDLSKYLGLATSPPTAETCVIIAKLPVGLVGLMADSASELARVKTFDFEVPSPVIAGMNGKLRSDCVQGVAHLSERLLVMLDLERLFTPGEQLTLSGENASQLPGKDDAAVANHTPETLFSGALDAEVGQSEQRQAVTDRHSLMTFELGGELYGVPLTDVAEVREPLALMPLPHVPAHVLGLVNLRGVVLPVIDLCRKFGLAPALNGREKRLVILKGPGYPVALWVDRVCGLARLPQTDFQPAPPGVARVNPEYYEQVVRLGERILIELNVRKLLTDTAARSDRTSLELSG